MQTLNLQKGDLLNLTKNYSKLKNIDLGLGWDVAVNGQAWDLDVSAISLNAEGKSIETVYYRNLSGIGVRLNGDNVTGAGDGDDEVITVNLDKVRNNVKIIGIFVNIYNANGRDFSKVKNAYIRMVNKDTGEEICKYKLNEKGQGFNAFHFANLVRTNNEWEFVTIGTGTNGSIMHLKEYFINKFTTNSAEMITATNEPNITIEETEKVGFFKKLFGKR